MTKKKINEYLLPETFDEAVKLAGEENVYKAIVNAHINFIVGVLISHGFTSEEEFIEGVRWHYDNIRNTLNEKEEIKWN